MGIIMGKFWLKIAIFAVLVGGVIFAVSVFSPFESEPVEKVEKPKTFYDVIREDDERLRPEPEPTGQPRHPRVRKTRAEEAEQQPRELTDVERVQAQTLFEAALFERKKARLPVPGMGYKRMVEYCRQIIKRFPTTPEALMARKMLAEVPENERERYGITDEELGLSK